MGRIIFSDVDGVLTDSKINIGEDGEVFKSFNVKDGYGIVEWNNVEDNKFVIITSRKSTAVKNRASELGVTEVHQNIKDKRQKVEQIIRQMGLSLDDAVYIGDDFSDLAAINTVSVGCCPADAPYEVRQQCEYVSQCNGGEGAVRDIINHLQNSTRSAVGVIQAGRDYMDLGDDPLTNIDGKPKIEHILRCVSRANLLEDVIILSDEEDILNAVESIGATVLVSDSDQNSWIDQVGEIAKDIESDIIINIPLNETVLEPALIDAVVKTLISKPPAVATLISKIDEKSTLEDSKSVKVVTDIEGKALYFSRSQIPFSGGTETTYENFDVYGFEKSLLIECTGMESDLEMAEGLEQLRLLEYGYEIQTINIACHHPSADKRTSCDD